jgi:hypothetical protein
MRALCGAIITAGALIGLGLTGMGLGSRYQGQAGTPSVHILFQDLDNPFKLILVLLVIGVVVGVSVAFIGLMYHDHRRHHEMLVHTPRDANVQQPQQRVAV